MNAASTPPRPITLHLSPGYYALDYGRWVQVVFVDEKLARAVLERLEKGQESRDV